VFPAGKAWESDSECLEKEGSDDDVRRKELRCAAGPPLGRARLPLTLLLFGGVPIADLVRGADVAQARTSSPTQASKPTRSVPTFRPRSTGRRLGPSPRWTSDFYNACAGNNPYVSVPVNSFGNQAARTGNGYAGFILRPSTSGSYREYIEVALTAPLAAGWPTTSRSTCRSRTSHAGESTNSVRIFPLARWDR